jgi:uncharacterized protein YciI
MKNIIVLLTLLVSIEMYAQNPYTIVFLHKKPDAEKISDEDRKKIMDGHMANINRLAEEGKLVAAGPFDGGGGLFVMKTSSVAEAQTWVDSDPGVKAKRWNVEILPFTPRQGGICKVSEPYEMVSYSFVRFNVVVSKFNATDFPQIVKKHDDYLKDLAKTGNIIGEGIFSERDGGILIMKGDVQKEVFENDPGVKEGLVELDIKKLYIARGSFCEK